MRKIGFLGFGNMNRALCEGILRGGEVFPGDVWASGRRHDVLQQNCAEFGINAAANNRSLVEICDVIFLGVKPPQVKDVLTEIEDVIGGKTLISVVNGMTKADFIEYLPSSTGIYCMIPNTPVAVGKGIMIVAGPPRLTPEKRAEVEALLAPCGALKEVDGLARKAMVSLADSGPALVAVLIEAFADAAVKAGLPRDMAYETTSELLIGVAELMKQKQLHPGQLKDAVCSPGGITIKGVAALERCGARHAVIEAIEATLDATPGA